MSTNRTLNSNNNIQFQSQSQSHYNYNYINNNQNLSANAFNNINNLNNLKSSNFDEIKKYQPENIKNNNNIININNFIKKDSLYLNNSKENKLGDSDENYFHEKYNMNINSNLYINILSYLEDYSKGLEIIERIFIKKEKYYYLNSNKDLNICKHIYFLDVINSLKNFIFINKESIFNMNNESNDKNLNQNKIDENLSTIKTPKNNKIYNLLSTEKKKDLKGENHIINNINIYSTNDNYNKEKINNIFSYISPKNKRKNSSIEKEKKNEKANPKDSSYNTNVNLNAYNDSKENEKENENGIRNNSNYLKYSNSKIKEIESYQEESSQNENENENKNKNEKGNENYNININNIGNNFKNNCFINVNNDIKNLIDYKKQYLNPAKILVKNISLYYKRIKGKLYSDFFIKFKKNIKWNRLSNLLTKNILLKHFIILDKYFYKLRKINQISNGINKLSLIFGKSVNFFFDLFNNKIRCLQLKRKYLEKLMIVINIINDRNKKFTIFENLNGLVFYKEKLPHFNSFLGKLFELMKNNLLKNSLNSIKKFYYSKKIYGKNLEYFIETISPLFIKDLKTFFNKLRYIYVVNIYLRNLLLKKHIKLMKYIKKYFNRFFENVFDDNDFFNIKMKLNKCMKIYTYHSKLNTIKV
jgi:hypothetical protein